MQQMMTVHRFCTFRLGTHRIPQQAFSHAVALPWGSRELEGCMHYIRLQAHHICHALHKEGVPTAEGGHWQDAHPQLPIKAPEDTTDARSSFDLH